MVDHISRSHETLQDEVSYRLLDRSQRRHRGQARGRKALRPAAHAPGAEAQQREAEPHLLRWAQPDREQSHVK